MEENRKGPGVFYAVVGVATLVVAIIGATFAYFSAEAKSDAGDIEGETLNLSTGVLSLDVSKITFSNTTAPSTNLVPADFGKAADELTATEISAALEAKCEESGYTGCHVYSIVATTTQSVTAASILVDLDVTTKVTGGKTSDWSYAVFTADTLNTDGTASVNVALAEVAEDKSAVGAIDDMNNLDINNGAAMTIDTGKTSYTETYYLMVYLKDNGVQNSGTADTDATANYSGTVTFNAGTGQVKATFTA